MKNFKQTAFNVLSTTALLTSVVAPVVALPASSFAASAGSVTAYTVPTVPNQGTASLGTVLMTIPAGALAGGDTVTLSLPHGFTFSTYDTSVGTAAGTNQVSVYETQGAQSVASATYSTVSAVSNNQIKININSVGAALTSPTDDVKIAVQLKNLTVNGPSNGPVNVTLDAPSSSAFPTGTVVVGNVQTNGMVDVAATDTTSGSNSFTFNLNLKEEVPGSIKANNGIKLKLPSGYVWSTGAGALPTNSSSLYGDALSNFKISGSGDTIYVNYAGTSATGTSAATSLKIPLTFVVNDDTQVKSGPVTAYIGGTSSVNVTSLQVGNYGDYSASVTASATPDVYAAKAQQTIGDLVIKESVPGTFVSGRTLELTLPDTARWEDVFENAAHNSKVVDTTSAGLHMNSNGTWNPTLNMTFTNGLSASANFTGTDYRTLKLTFSGNGSLNNTDPGEIDLKNVQIATSARAKGDINLTLGGTSGVTGTVKVAAAKPAGTIAVSAVKNISAGKNDQAIGDITVTEAAPDVFNGDTADSKATNTREIRVLLDNSGVKWNKTPNVTVTSGDAKVTNVFTSTLTDGTNRGYVSFTLDSASTSAPAVITLSGGTVNVDNTVADGPVPVKLQGQAVAYASYYVSAWDNDTHTAASTSLVNVSSADSTGNASFVIGSADYTVNGQKQKLDVTPFIDANGRTQLPVRAVAEALGASVSWDQDSQTASIVKNGKAIAVTVGSTKMNVGGVSVATDSAAINKDGRIFLPFRAIAEALGAQVSWDAATQTVSLH